MARLVRYAWFVLVFNVGVILVGALVRATGSGAGCGRSWPTCQGEVLPELGGATAIEFTHRAVSGAALILGVVLLAWVWRETQPGAPARVGAAMAVVGLVISSLIGAMIVLAEWVADDDSVARVVTIPLHLVNTLFLLAALTLTIFWLSGGGELRWAANTRLRRTLILGGTAILLLFATGAVTALADTLFPKGGDLTDEAHFLTNLRVVHPALAVAATGAGWWASRRSGLAPGWPGKAMPILVGLMLLTGAVNVVLGVPVFVQLIHLALADVLWVAYVMLAARLLSSVPALVTP